MKTVVFIYLSFLFMFETEMSPLSFVLLEDKVKSVQNSRRVRQETGTLLLNCFCLKGSRKFVILMFCPLWHEAKIELW